MRVIVCFQLKKSKTRLDGKCPLYLRCTMNGQRFEISTGFFLDSDDWIEMAQQAKGKSEDVKVINNRLDKIRTKIQDIYNQLESLGEPFDVELIRNRFLGKSSNKGLLEVFDDVLSNIEARIGKDYAFATLKQYRTTKNRLKEFINLQKSAKDIAITKINYNFLNSFDVYLKKTYDSMPNTAWTYHKHMKKVLNVSIAMGYISRNPYESFKMTKKDTNRDFLTLHEVNRIKEKKISILRLEIVRDIFVFACYTGLSYSDIAKLNNSHFQKGDDNNFWIIVDRTKTESRCRIPLLSEALEILKKYENHRLLSASNRLLPVSSNQKMNAYLKELADICDIQKNLTMHVARHTFATSVTLSNGVPIEPVSKMLGHTSLKTTQIYARIIDSKISNDMSQLQKKLHKESLEYVI